MTLLGAALLAKAAGGSEASRTSGERSSTVKATSAELASAAGVADAEGCRQLVEQGGYVEATEVRLAQ